MIRCRSNNFSARAGLFCGAFLGVSKRRPECGLKITPWKIQRDFLQPAGRDLCNTLFVDMQLRSSPGITEK
jgi:hypothetical protein